MVNVLKHFFAWGNNIYCRKYPHLVSLSCVVFAGVSCCTGAVPILRLLSPLLLDFLDHCRIVLGLPLARNVQVPSVAYHFGGKARLGKKKTKELLAGNINLITLSELQ